MTVAIPTQIIDLVQRRVPNYQVNSVEIIGGTGDSVVYEVNDEMIIRLNQKTPGTERHDEVVHQIGLLSAVSAISQLVVPTPYFADADAGVIAYAKIIGTPLLDRPIQDPKDFAARLGEFIKRLHEAPIDELRQLIRRDGKSLQQLHGHAVEDFETIQGRLSDTVQRAVTLFLQAELPPVSQERALCHNDLGAENMLVNDEGTLIGIVDWADAAVTDPLRDFALVYRDLGAEMLDDVLAAANKSIDAEEYARLVFYARCSVLARIAHATQSQHNALVALEMKRIEELFLPIV